MRTKILARVTLRYFIKYVEQSTLRRKPSEPALTIPLREVPDL